MTMGHRVAVLNFGVLQQVDRPSVLYSRPANRFVAGFIGSPAMNIVDITARDGQLWLGTSTVPVSDDVAADLAERGDGTYGVGVRPDTWRSGPRGCLVR